jgi:hypothetical protein
MCFMFSIFSMCSMCFFYSRNFILYHNVRLKSFHKFCRFEVVLSFRGDVGLMIILKQVYILYISNTQRKYASLENSVSRTLHLRVLFHQQFALHIRSTVSAPLPRPSVQFNGRAPAHDNTEHHKQDTG